MVYRGVTAQATACLAASCIEISALCIAGSLLIRAEANATVVVMGVTAFLLAVAAAQHISLRSKVRRIVLHSAGEHGDERDEAATGSPESPHAHVVAGAPAGQRRSPIIQTASTEDLSSLRSSRETHTPRGPVGRTSGPPAIVSVMPVAEDAPSAPSLASSVSSSAVGAPRGRPTSSSRRSHETDRRVVVASGAHGLSAGTGSSLCNSPNLQPQRSGSAAEACPPRHSATPPSPRRSVPLSELHDPRVSAEKTSHTASNVANPLKLPPALQAAREDRGSPVRGAASRHSESAEELPETLSFVGAHVASGVVACAHVVLAIVAAVETESPFFFVYLLAAASHLLSPLGFHDRARLVAGGVTTLAALWVVGIGATCGTATGTSAFVQKMLHDEGNLRTTWAAAAFANGGVALSLVARQYVAAWFAAGEIADVTDVRLLRSVVTFAGQPRTQEEAWCAADDIDDAELREQCFVMLDTMREALAFAPGMGSAPATLTPAAVSPTAADSDSTARKHSSAMFTSVSGHGSMLMSHTYGSATGLRGVPGAMSNRSSFRSMPSRSPPAHGGVLPPPAGLPPPRPVSRLSVSSLSPGTAALRAPVTPFSASRRAAHHETGMFGVVVVGAFASHASDFAESLEYLYSAVEHATGGGGTLLQGASDEMVVVFPVGDNASHTASLAVTCALDAVAGAAESDVRVTASVAIGSGTRTTVGQTLRSVRLTGPVMTTARALVACGSQLRTGAVYCDGNVAQDAANTHVVMPVELTRVPGVGATCVYRVLSALNLPFGLANEEWMYQLQKITDATPASVPNLRRAFADFASGKYEAALGRWRDLQGDVYAGAADVPRLVARCEALRDEEAAGADKDTGDKTVLTVVVGVGEPATRVSVPSRILGPAAGVYAESEVGSAAS